MTVSDPDAYSDFLSAHVRGGPVYLCPYRGNSGDHLIRLGTLELLDRLGIPVTHNPGIASLVIWPGGNPTMWQSNVDGWVEILKRARNAPFLVGPATFQNSELPWSSVIAANKDRFAGLFARDPVSFQNLSRAVDGRGIKIGLAHDPALYLAGSEWLSQYRQGSASNHVLAAFRRDHESEFQKSSYAFLPRFIRRRLAERQKGAFMQRRLEQLKAGQGSDVPLLVADVAQWDFESFVDAVLRAVEVHTDRLHTMVLAALLGKRVVGYPTSYRKLETVYTFSLKDSFPNITFIDGEKVHARVEKT